MDRRTKPPMSCLTLMLRTTPLLLVLLLASCGCGDGWLPFDAEVWMSPENHRAEEITPRWRMRFSAAEQIKKGMTVEEV